MNVYQKLAEARYKLKSLGLKQSGKNKGVGYTYFDLQDILPQTTRIEKELGLLSVVSFTETEGTLRVINAENPEESIQFSSPIRDAELRGCHPVQNLGAVETYVRRYLYLLAYEIVETEALDLTQGSEKQSLSKTKEHNKQTPAEPEKTAQNANNEATEQNNQSSEEDYEFPPESYKCVVCGKVITRKLFEQSLKKYGTPLCSAECKEVLVKTGDLLMGR